MNSAHGFSEGSEMHETKSKFSLLGFFKAMRSIPKPPPPKPRRNFDNVPWKWITGEGMRTHHIFLFTNGLGLIVFKECNGVFDGMEAIAVEKFNPDGSFIKFQMPEINFYNRRGGIDVAEVEQFKDEVRRFKRYELK